jgi:hypothetical protein
MEPTILSAFDKINLAACAVARANQAILSAERFTGEFDTAMLWKGHRVAQTQTPRGVHAYRSPA